MVVGALPSVTHIHTHTVSLAFFSWFGKQRRSLSSPPQIYRYTCIFQLFYFYFFNCNRRGGTDGLAHTIRLGVRLSVKIGIGCGEVTILHIGGVHKRLEYLAVGEPLVHAFNAEHHATKNELVVSPAAWDRVDSFFKADVTDDGYAFVSECLEPVRKISVVKTTQNRDALTPAVRNVFCFVYGLDFSNASLI